MTLLTPLGLLGLIGVVILIIIYIIKPNYQQKVISSTYIWKLSLRYKRKRIPVSKLRNLLIILCQIFILTACAAILAQPNKVLKNQVKTPEVIAIIDSSASMRTSKEDEDGYTSTRFERAVNGVIELSDAIFDKNGHVSVILADTSASFLVQRITRDNRDEVRYQLEPLIADLETQCSYGSADIDSAIELCENVLLENPFAEIKLFTDTRYYKVPKSVEIVSVCAEEEWNASILNAKAVRSDSYYTFYVDVACYGREEAELHLNFSVKGANSTNNLDPGQKIEIQLEVPCVNGEVKQIVFMNKALFWENNESLMEEGADSMELIYLPGYSAVVYYSNNPSIIYYLMENEAKNIKDNEAVSTFQEVHLYLTETDNFAEDNSFNIFGGKKDTIRIQYFSPRPNSFFNAVLLSLKNNYSDRWNIEYKQVKVEEEPELQGFDFYVFEHEMPETLPRDGVILLVNPNRAPAGADFSIGGEISFSAEPYPTLKAESSSNLLEDVVPNAITVSKYYRITQYNKAYENLMSLNGDPMLLVRNDPGLRAAVIPFSLHYSNLPLLNSFPFLISNLFNYFIPTTVSGNSFEVYESVKVNARGPELEVSYRGETIQVFDNFPSTLKMDLPGTYTLTQTTYTNKEITESIHVRIPESECDIWKVEEVLKEPYKPAEKTIFYDDLLVYIAAALVAVLFLERLLQSRDS